MLHCFSVDVEGFGEGMSESISVPAGIVGSAEDRREIESNIAQMLHWLDEEGVLATFFVLGRIAEQQPEVVRAIVAAGHELASHSHDHVRLYNLPLAEARRQIERSKKALEDASGHAVVGFRAPDFSITGKNPEILDALVECGYAYDSSLSPVSFHDVYGVPGGGRWIHRLPNGLLEFPPATVDIAGHVFPVLGGGYMRVTPTFVARWITAHLESRDRPAMTYIHPYEIGDVHPRIPGLPWARRLRHYGNLGRARGRYTALFRRYSFGSAQAVLQQRGHALGGPSGSALRTRSA